MLAFEGRNGVEFCDGLTRRDFLRAGALSAGAIGLSLGELGQLSAASRSSIGEMNCILLFLVGGPSHLDTWDPKPDAPSHIRGPFRPICTNVSGIEISECFPRMAAMANRYALVRSVYHDAPPVHEIGHQLLQTGRLCRDGTEYPHLGAAVSRLRGGRGELPANVVLPQPIGNTGVSISHGQSAGFLGGAHQGFVLGSDDANLDPARLASHKALVAAVDAAQRAYESRARASGMEAPGLSRLFGSNVKKAFDLFAESAEVRQRYGRNTFGQSCLLARRLIEHGVRFATVNMFDTVFNQVTWDCHADGGALATGLNEYRNVLCPMFDRAYTALLDDLQDRGLMANTMVVAMGEFGRTPVINPRGGRDHWPGVWTVLFAGGRVRGGQVIGSSDARGQEPKARPVHASQIAATVYHGIGIDPRQSIATPSGESVPLVDADPVVELFR